MLLTPEPLRKRRAEIARDYAAGKITQREAGERLTEAVPDFGGGYALLGNALVDEGDLAAAEASYGKALDRMPCDYTAYLALAEVLRKRGGDDPLSQRLLELGIWKLALGGEIPEEVAGYFRERMGELLPDFDFKSPATYEAIVTSLEQAEGAAAKVRERLLPYELLNDLQRQSGAGLDADLFRETVANAERCIPVWRAALRESMESPAALPLDALGKTIALIGEASGPEALEELLELIDSGERSIFLHANWAVWRLGQRFPAEALAKLRAAGTGAPAVRRCAVAEQIDMLPETPGIPEALLQALDGFGGIVREPDAAYLLAMVVDALEYRERLHEAEPTYQRLLGALSKGDRREVREMLDRGIVTRLVEEEIDEVTIEDICCGRMLMDDEGEGAYEYEDEEEYEEAITPVVAKAKPGRNEPCWCGSGKKYKKCHLTADEEAQRSGAPATKDPAAEPVHVKLHRELMRHTTDWHSASDFAEGSQLYFDRPAEELEDQDPDVLGGFFEWYIYDFRPRSTRRTLLEEYLRRRGGELTGAERELLQSWMKARFSLWEVQRVEEGNGLEIKDLLEGGGFFVHDVSCSRSMARWDCVMARVHESGGVWYFAGNGLGVPRNLMRQFMERIERQSREAGQAPAAFVRTNSHCWHRVVHEMAQEQLAGLRMVNFEGDAVEFCAASYEVIDRGEVLKALEAAGPFDDRQDLPDVCSFAWLEADAGGQGRSYGSIEIRDVNLRLECNSRKRLEMGRRLVEEHAGRWLRHLGDSFESQDEFKRKALDPKAPKKARPPSGIPPEVERENLGKLKAEHYARWVDERLPALDGQTPKEAARSKTGRRALEDLLRTMENGEERSRREGGPGFDFSAIRKSLGM